MEDQYTETDDGLDVSAQSDDADDVLGNAAKTTGSGIMSPRDPAS